MKSFYSWKQKEKGKAKEESPAPQEHGATITERIATNEQRPGWRNSWNMTPAERARLHEQKKSWKDERAGAAARGGTFIEEVRPVSGHNGANQHDDEFEQAILTAVRETSKGDATEDSRIEHAIRSSVQAIRRRSTTMQSFASASSRASSAQDSGYLSDIKRPVLEEANKNAPGSAHVPEDILDITDEEYQALIEQAVALSISDSQHRGTRRVDSDDSEEDEDFKQALVRSQTDRSLSHENDEDDEEYKKAIQISEKELENNGVDEEEELRKAIEASQAEQNTNGGDDEEELRRAIEESERAHREDLARASSLRTEEDIVLEYVKKQSLAEAEFRKTRGAEGGASGDVDMDEELRRALEESMKSQESVGRGGGGGPSKLG